MPTVKKHSVDDGLSLNLSANCQKTQCGGWFIRSDITKGVNRSADVSALILQDFGISQTKV